MTYSRQVLLLSYTHCLLFYFLPSVSMSQGCTDWLCTHCLVQVDLECLWPQPEIKVYKTRERSIILFLFHILAMCDFEIKVSEIMSNSNCMSRFSFLPISIMIMKRHQSWRIVKQQLHKFIKCIVILDFTEWLCTTSPPRHWCALDFI